MIRLGQPPLFLYLKVSSQVTLIISVKFILQCNNIAMQVTRGEGHGGYFRILPTTKTTAHCQKEIILAFLKMVRRFYPRLLQ